MKRWMSVVIGSVMILGTAGACDPGPPAGWVRPQVTNLVVAPAPVVPGQPFTVSATLSDDHHVTSMSLWMISSTGQEVVDVCGAPGFVAQPQVDVVLTCQLSDFAVNGTWTVILNAFDGEVSTEHGNGAGQASTTFQVVGGTNDDDPPVLDALTLSPASPAQGQPFTVTALVSDDHVAPANSGALTFDDGSVDTRYCQSTFGTPTSPTQQQFVFTCPNPASIPAGHHQLHLYVFDVNDNRLLHTSGFDIVGA